MIGPAGRNMFRPGPALMSAGHPHLEHRQVALELPGRDLHPVVVPLLALDLDVAVEHVLAEGAKDELGLGRQLDRLAQALGQLLDTEPPAASALALYVPAFYPGTIHYPKAEQTGDLYPPNPARIWPPLARALKLGGAPGEHVSMIRTPSRAVAAAIDAVEALEF